MRKGTMRDLVPILPAAESRPRYQVPATLQDLAEKAADYASKARAAHEHAGAPLDLASSRGFREVWKGIKREHGTAPAQKAALMTPELRAAIETLPAESLAGLRDR